MDAEAHDGNDWYAQSGPIAAGGFADTSAQLALRDMPHGYPAETAHPVPDLAATRQQSRYDEDVATYPGYGAVDGPPARGRSYDDYANETRLDQVAVDYDAMDGGRGYGQALQGDDFDGGGLPRGGRPHPVAGTDFLSSPGRGRPGDGGKGQRQAGKPRKRGVLAIALSAAGVVLVAAVGVGVYRYVVKPTSNNSDAQAVTQPLPTEAPASATAQCVKQFGQFCHIQLRTDDPTPLTIGELFPRAVFNQKSNTNYDLAGTNDTEKDCSKAVVGSDLIAQLKKGQCTQALRASYVTDNQDIAGTIGVFNLASTNQAHYAGKVVGAANFILPLSSSSGAIAKLGNGTGVVEAEYKGHYLLVVWAQFTNSQAKPTAAQTQQLESFESGLVASTANAYLSQRMINGDSSAGTPSGGTTASASASASTSAKPSATGAG
jgi:hypothetical protein